MSCGGEPTLLASSDQSDHVRATFGWPDSCAFAVVSTLTSTSDRGAGATVLRGLMGYGAHSRLHTPKIERLSEDLPIVVEIVDTREKLQAFLSLIDGVIPEGLATLEKAFVHFYRQGKPSS